MMNCFVDRKLLFTVESLSQRLPFDIRHHVVKKALRLAGIEQWKYMRMIQPCSELDLPQKPIGAEGRGELGVKHLERNDAVVLDVLREVHGRHAAATELAIHRVRVRKCGAELFSRQTHRHIACAIARKRGVSRIGLRSESWSIHSL